MNIDVLNLLKGEILLEGEMMNAADMVLNHKLVALYFSGNWCPPCRIFTPLLNDFYHELLAKHADIEIVFCSVDNNESEFQEYYSTMPWFALPFGDDRIQSLSDAGNVEGYPTLLFIDVLTGKILNEGHDSRKIVKEMNFNLVLEWTK